MTFSLFKTVDLTKYRLDLNRIRSDHRLCGLLVGTLPHLSQQNVFLGLPSQLTPEEATLLVEKGIFLSYPNPSNL